MKRTVASAKSPDDIEIRYETAGQSDPALVFLHGWSCDRTYWREQLPHFANSHRVVAIDLAGHGESGLGRAEWTIAAYGEDVSAVVKALDLQSAVLIGHSSGAMVIVEAANLLPGRVAALVAVDFFEAPERHRTENEIQSLMAPLRADFRGTTEAMVRSYFPATSDPKLIDWIARDMSSAPPEVAIPSLESARRYDQRRGLASVKVPMRLINSDFWPSDIEAARRYKPDIQLATMPGLGHFPMLEDPDEFNRLLARAISDLTRNH